MKALSYLPLLAAGLLLTGCASSEPRNERAAHPHHTHKGDRTQWNHAPEPGMTKAQVRNRYGDPTSVHKSRRGEVWVYRARLHSKDLIPVYGQVTHQRNGGNIRFDNKGRVVGFDWGRDRWGMRF